MAQVFRMVAAGAIWLAAAVPLLSHHALAGEYDPKVVITITGRVTTVEWTNPHAFVYIEVTTPEGKTETWRIEGGSPGQLAKREIPHERLAVGTAVKVLGFRAKDHSTKLWGRDITFADGTTVYMGSGRTPPPIAPVPPRPPEPPAPPPPLLLYILGVPGVVLIAGLFVMWWKRGKHGHGQAP